MIKIEASAPLPMKKWQFEFSVISWAEVWKEHLIISKWLDISKILKDEWPIIVRIHSECITWDLFWSQRCDCWAQLDASLELIEKSWKWILIYLRQEGRGIWLVKKIKAYNLQDWWLDTVEANEKLWLRADARDYKIAADILKLIWIKSIDLISNNPQKQWLRNLLN